MFEEIIAKINQYDSIVIFGHINPDGDCYGSQIGLKSILKANYPDKQIYAVGSGLKQFYEVFGQLDEVDDETITHSLALVLDSNDLPRIEDQRVVKALDFAKIDHHIDTFTFHEGPEVIDTTVTSTCELIYHFAVENHLKITKLAANALYLGILTDTARFQYANDYPRMFSVLHDLCVLGVEPKKITMILNITNENSLKLKSFVYQNIKKSEDGVLYLLVSKKEREELGVTSGQMVSHIGLIGNIDKYPIWAIVSETDIGGMQVEIRSNNINVQKIAFSFGGGGHAYAAGFTLKEYKQETLDKLLNMLKAAAKEGK